MKITAALVESATWSLNHHEIPFQQQEPSSAGPKTLTEVQGCEVKRQGSTRIPQCSLVSPALKASLASADEHILLPQSYSPAVLDPSLPGVHSLSRGARSLRSLKPLVRVRSSTGQSQSCCRVGWCPAQSGVCMFLHEIPSMDWLFEVHSLTSFCVPLPCSSQQWLARSRRLASPPVARRPGSSWPRRPLASPRPPLVRYHIHIRVHLTMLHFPACQSRLCLAQISRCMLWHPATSVQVHVMMSSCMS